MAKGNIVRANTAADGSQSDGAHHDAPSVSEDGRYVAFASTGSNFVPDDTNGTIDIFVKDLVSGAIVRASTAADGTQGNGFSEYPSLSPDGRYVAFASEADNLVPGDTNGEEDVFVKDLKTDGIVRASTRADGAEADGSSFQPVLSANGRSVAFSSHADNLVPGDNGGPQNIFAKDLVSGAIVQVNTAADGTPPVGETYSIPYSFQGRYVAFDSTAPNLVPDDTNDRSDSFVKDLESGEVIRVSTTEDGEQGNGSSGGGDLSADGRHVAFTSDSSNLVPDDTNGKSDVFIKNLETGEVLRASTATDGTQGNGRILWSPRLSPDGRYVAFDSDSSNLVPGDANDGYDVFVKDLKTGETLRASTRADQAEADDGSYFAWSTSPAISGDGQTVAFQSHSSNLVPGDTNGEADIFVKDLSSSGFTGTSGADVLSGTYLADIMRGLGGDDILNGGHGNDSLFGEDLGGVIPPLEGAPILWNKLDGPLEGSIWPTLFDTLPSEIGVDGKSNAPDHGMTLPYGFVQHGNGVGHAFWIPHRFYYEGFLKFSNPFAAGFGDAGAIEFWWLNGHDENASPGDNEGPLEVFELPWMRLSYRSGNDRTEVAFQIKDDDGNILSQYDTVYDLDYQAGEIHHLALSWDKSWGSAPIKLFFDGKEVDAEHVSAVEPERLIERVQDRVSDPDFEHALNILPAHVYTSGQGEFGPIEHTDYDGSLIDNIKIWDHAKIDFSDRYIEDSGAVPADDGCVRVSFTGEDAAYRNTYGWYDTRTGEAEILVANVDTLTNADLADFTATLPITADRIQHLGFFIIPDGYDQNGDLGEPFADGDGTDLDLEVYEINGVWHVRDVASGSILEGLGAPAYFTESAKNPAGNDHVREAGDLLTDGAVIHNWEDLPGLGDADFNDAAFKVSLVCDPGTSGDDVLIGGAGDDTLTGGPGADTFHFEGSDFGRDQITDFVLAEDSLAFDGVGGADDTADFTYTVGDYGGGAAPDIRITFAGLGADLADEGIDVLDIGSDIDALRADIVFV